MRAVGGGRSFGTATAATAIRGKRKPGSKTVVAAVELSTPSDCFTGGTIRARSAAVEQAPTASGSGISVAPSLTQRLTASSERETGGGSVAAALETPSWPTTMSGSASDPTRIRSRMEERDVPHPCTTGRGEGQL